MFDVRDDDWRPSGLCRPGGRLVEITPAMTEAGADVICGFDCSGEEYWADRVFRAMQDAAPALPSGCRMWEAQQEIRMLRKQLKEAMLKIAKLKRENNNEPSM